MKPAIFLLQVVHGCVKVVKELVLEIWVINKIPLASCVVITTVVAGSREVQPLRVSKLIACDSIKHKKQFLDVSCHFSSFHNYVFGVMF